MKDVVSDQFGSFASLFSPSVSHASAFSFEMLNTYAYFPSTVTVPTNKPTIWLFDYCLDR